MKKHILSVLMCLCLALSLVPTAALAADTTNYDIWVGGVQVTSANAGNVLCDGTVRYDAQTGTLTLDNANITGTNTDVSGVGAAIYADTDLTLALTGDNSAIGPITGIKSYGVYCSGALAITGSGSLSAVGGTATSGYSSGVYGNTVTISDTARVNAVGGESLVGDSCGVTGDSITVSGSAWVTTTGGSAAANGSSYGINGTSIIISDSARVTAIGGSAKYGSLGLGASSCSIDISGGTVTAVGGESDGGSGGLLAADITITGGVVTATGGKAGVSDGVFSSSDILAVNNGGSAANNGLLVAKGETSATNMTPVCGDGSAALTGSESEKFAIWGEKNKYFVLDSRADDAVTAGTLEGHAQLTGTGLALAANAGSSSAGDPATAGYSWTDSDSDGTYDTLTLKNVIVNAPDATSDYAYGVELPDGSAGVNVVLEGINVVRAGNADSGNSFGVYSAQEDSGSIAIAGDGALYALGGLAKYESSGVESDNADITVSGGALVALGGLSNNWSCGVDGENDVAISGGTVTAVSSSANYNSFGVYGYSVITISAGAVTAMGGSGMDGSLGRSSGVCGDTGVAISSGTVTAVGGPTNHESYGVYGDSNVTVDTDAIVTAVGGDAGDGSSYGIYNDNDYGGGTVLLSGIVIAVGGSAAGGGSYGVYGVNSVTVGTGTVTAVGGGYGMASGGSICLNGGTTIAAGGVFALSEVPNLTGYTTAYALAVGSSTDGSDASAWDESTGLDTYKYLKIAPMHVLAVNLNGGSGATVGGDHAAGEAVSIDAGTKSGYIFSGWTATGGGTFADASGAATTYTMPAGAATITANWAAISSGGGTSTPVITVPVSSDAGTVEVSASVSGTTARVSGTDAQLQGIASGAEAAGTIKLDVSDLKVDTVVVPSKLISTASGAALEVALPNGTVTLNKDALASVADKGDVKLSVETVDNSALTDIQKEVLGKQADTATVVDINLYAGGDQVSTFGDGTLQVSIPYTLKAGENADSVTISYGDLLAV